MSQLRTDSLGVIRRGRSILDDVTLNLGDRGLIAIVGPNGAGKSTLLKCLAGIMTPDSGHVMLDDRSLQTWPGRMRAKKMGFLPQHFEPHWDFIGAEILAIGAARAGVPTPEAPELSALLASRWSTLSGGERTRVLFAAIEAGQPAILLADEPAANLDIARQIEAMKRLRAHSTTGLAVVVLHDLNLAVRGADRLIVIHNGKVMMDGVPAEVAQNAMLDEIFGIAFLREQLSDGLWIRPKEF